jgi:prolyl-tRNA editing enzyme YbaK/EbsC (Cys-tRNA(Pro) deacylase)
MKTAAARVQRALETNGLACRVVELPESTRTAAIAAAAIGCEVAQIAKSIVFRGLTSGRAVIVVAPGSVRVDEQSVAKAAGEAISRAEADWVKDTVGYAIGGVPPLGHLGEPCVLFDRGLLAFDVVWAAAGTPNAVFSVAPADLLRACGGRLL